MVEPSPRRIEELFDQAVDLDPARLATFLDEQCAGDADLRGAVEELLHLDRSAHAAESLLRSPLAGSRPKAFAPQAPRFPAIDCYRVVGVLGEGGMGVVYEAEQDSPRRPVALKVVRPGLASPAVIKRFAHEAQILARLHHPGIAQVYEAGIADDGQPFFAMEFIRGLPLDEFADRQGLDLAARLGLVARVCDAVQHAHDRGVIHRDLKPANILVEETGEPKVLDFGVARATDADLLTAAGLTRTGQLLGTPNYMSPEQVTGDPALIDHRTDVYALGVILFELAAHRLPYRLEDRPLAEAARLILEQDPPRLGSLDPELRGDVETIVAKALEKDPARRYASAAELAADLRRYLNHEPIRARSVGPGARLARWCRRRPGTAALLAALALVVLTSLPLVTWKWREAEATARREIGARRRAEQRRQEARRSLYVANVLLAQQAYNGGQVEYMRALLDEAARREPGDDDLRGFEWHYLRRLGHRKVKTLGRYSGDSVAFSQDGRRLAVGDTDGTVHVWEPATGKELVALKGHDRGVLSVAFNPDGRFLASGGSDHTVRVWEADSGREVHTLRAHTDEVRGVAYSPDGRRLASASSDNAVRVWEAETGRELLTISPYPDAVMGVAYSPDGRRLALAYGNQRVGVYEATTGKELLVLTPQTGWVTGVAFSPDGRRLAAGSEDRAVHVWEAETGKELLALRGHADWVTGVAFSGDGRLASASRDGTARVWDAATGRELLTLQGHTNWVMGVAFSPDARHLATAGYDRTVRLWEGGGGRPTVTEHPYPVRGVAFSGDGRRLASAGEDARVRVWEAAGGQEPLAFRGHSHWVTGVAFSPGGHRVASSSRDGTVRLWEVDTGRELRVFRGHTDWVLGVAFRPDGRWLASAGRDQTVRLWEVDTGRELRIFRGHAREVLSVAFSPDGRRLAWAEGTGPVPAEAVPGVRVWDAEDGRELLAVTDPLVEQCAMAFSPDGRWLASACGDRTVRLWEADTGRELRIFRGHAGEVLGVAYSPDGHRLASACADQTVRLWEADTGRELLVLRGHTGRVIGVAFSPDGQRLASGSEDKTVRLWDATSGEELVGLP